MSWVYHRTKDLFMSLKTYFIYLCAHAWKCLWMPAEARRPLELQLQRVVSLVRTKLWSSKRAVSALSS